LQKLKAIYTITRFPNLVFIFLTQILVYDKLIYTPLQSVNATRIFAFTDMILLAISTTLIAMGGYIINDYFDVKIDEINKPNRVTVELQFRRRYIMFAHIAINFVALCIALPLAFKAGHISLLGIQLLSIILLVLYSAYFKRKPIIGNIIVAILTALTVLTPALFEHQIIFTNYFYTIICIAIFAFIYTWMREIVKDLEDIKGDEADGCRTMPIVFGIKASKYALYILALFMMIYCILIIVNANEIFIIFITSMLTVHIVGTIIFCSKLSKSYQHKHFKWLSRFLKIITFIGILQILFI
jgi:4-hydroxybenzoate polyprenyltransferase